MIPLFPLLGGGRCEFSQKNELKIVRLTKVGITNHHLVSNVYYVNTTMANLYSPLDDERKLKQPNYLVLMCNSLMRIDHKHIYTQVIE